MSEQRLIDANKIDPSEVFVGESDFAKECRQGVDVLLAYQPTIDPKTLPIVKELREKLARYEKAEQEGRLIKLPCKIGASVRGKNENWSGTVDEFSVNSDGVFLFVNSGYSGYEKPEDVVFCEEDS